MARHEENWHHLGPLLQFEFIFPMINMDIPPQIFRDFVVSTCFNDQDLYKALFNGGQGNINAIFEYTANKHPGVHESAFDNLVIIREYSPITLSFNFRYLLHDSDFITHQNANTFMHNNDNLPPNFCNWNEFLQSTIPLSSTLLLDPYKNVVRNHDFEIDTDLYFRWFESTEIGNQTQQRELHIRVIQEQAPYLIPDHVNPPNDDDRLKWNILGYNIIDEEFRHGWGGDIPLMYRSGDDVDKFLESFPNGRMKDRINSGLAIRIPNIYCTMNNLKDWTVLHGAQIKMSTTNQDYPKSLRISAIQSNRCDFYMFGRRRIQTYYRWRDGYLEFKFKIYRNNH